MAALIKAERVSQASSEGGTTLWVLLFIAPPPPIHPFKVQAHVAAAYSCLMGKDNVLHNRLQLDSAYLESPVRESTFI